MVNAFSDYTGVSGQGNTSVSDDLKGPQKQEYWTLSKLKKTYMDYLGTKRQEIEEQKQSRRYHNSVQWTNAEIKAFKKRRQPIVTYNRIKPKINGVIGLIEKLKQSPKGYPRTDQEQQRGGDDVATAVIRYVLDEQEWKTKAPFCAEDGAVDGIGGIQLELVKGDQGDPEIGFNTVEPECFFYDPRSKKLDFSDARFMGYSKWVDVETAKEMFPGKEEEIEDSVEAGFDLTSDPDNEQKWFSSDGDIRRVRIVDEWYRKDGNWYYAIYTGSLILMEGISYFVDEKGQTECKFIMFSANVDQDGDRYGFVRQYKSAQDEINQRRSKGLHLINSRRIIAEKGQFENIEEIRVEAARPDGIVEYNPGSGVPPQFDDAARLAETKAQLELLQDAKNEIDGYGPNLALVGETEKELSGRAIALQQQAGIAQLGPFIIAYRSWKIRVYRAIWNAIRKHWTAERMIRVTDDPSSIQFVKLNSIGLHPQTGMPTMVNQVQSLDVDIILDEGPDSINMAADSWDAISQAMQNGMQIPPQIFIEAMPGLDGETRKRWLDQLNQPNPIDQQKAQMELAHAGAVIQDVQAAAKLKGAQAAVAIHGAMNPEQSGTPENPGLTQAEIDDKEADAGLKKAQTLLTLTQAGLAPREQMHQEQMDKIGAVQTAQDSAMQQQQAAQPDPDQEFERQEKQKKSQREDELHQLKVASSKQDMQIKAHQAGMGEKEFKLKQDAQDEKLAGGRPIAAIAEDIASKLAGIQDTQKDTHKQVQALAKSHEKLQGDVDELSSPMEVVRDKAGRIAQINKGKRKMKVARDNAGRMTGVG